MNLFRSPLSPLTSTTHDNQSFETTDLKSRNIDHFIILVLIRPRCDRYLFNSVGYDLKHISIIFLAFDGADSRLPPYLISMVSLLFMFTLMLLLFLS